VTCTKEVSPGAATTGAHFRYAYFPKDAIKCPGMVKGTLRAFRNPIFKRWRSI
jgi:hypothetical protein